MQQCTHKKGNKPKSKIIIITNTKALKDVIDSSIKVMINDVFYQSVAPIEVGIIIL